MIYSLESLFGILVILTKKRQFAILCLHKRYGLAFGQFELSTGSVQSEKSSVKRKAKEAILKRLVSSSDIAQGLQYARHVLHFGQSLIRNSESMLASLC